MPTRYRRRMRRPTLRDVARTCGVSPATVSKALNPHADRCDIGAATRARVIAEAERLGFRPSPSHGRRTRRLWRNIGLMWGRYAPFTSGVYEGVLDVIGARLFGAGWRLLLTPVPEPAAWPAMQMAQRLDGVLAVSHVPEAVLADLAAARYPAVLLNLRTALPLPQFLPDDRAGAAALAAHLAGLGHRRVVYLEQAGAGVRHASERERPEALLAGGLRLERTADLAMAVALCRAGATAVICYDWSRVAQAHAALRAAGLGMPGQVSLASCSDLHWFAHLDPAVTAVEIPMHELAERAADHLLALLAGDVPAAPATVELPTVLRVRTSTGPAPG